jgi:hypothetical protein
VVRPFGYVLPRAFRPAAPAGPGGLELQTFTDKYAISDGNETIEFYHVDGLNWIGTCVAIQLQPLDVSEQRHRVGTDSHSPACLQRAVLVKVPTDHDLLLREIRNQHLSLWQSGFECRFRTDRRGPPLLGT